MFNPCGAEGSIFGTQTKEMLPRVVSSGACVPQQTSSAFTTRVWNDGRDLTLPLSASCLPMISLHLYSWTHLNTVNSCLRNSHSAVAGSMEGKCLAQVNEQESREHCRGSSRGRSLERLLDLARCTPFEGEC